MDGNASRRRRSMTDAFNFIRNPDAAGTARNDLFAMLGEMRQRNARLDGFASSLPKLSESDLAALGQSDSMCPICLTSLLAILAEEETAQAMDSPAHPIEELGVTRLADTCGHVFCRKDIRGWLYQGNTTCPTCRTPFMTGTADAAPEAAAGPASGAGDYPSDPAEASFAAFFENEVARAFGALHAATGAGPRASDTGATTRGSDGQGGSSDEEMHMEEAHFEYNHDRDEFSGMYS